MHAVSHHDTAGTSTYPPGPDLLCHQPPAAAATVVVQWHQHPPIDATFDIDGQPARVVPGTPQVRLPPPLRL
eukprot:2212477-Rhodomonas_salina.1